MKPIISSRDQMAVGISEEEYLLVGRTALDLCREALASATPGIVVDFPCGHGRVMRHFAAAWPNAELYGVEIDTDALKFVEATFGARPIQSGAHIAAVALPENVDLIWSGSLLTHLPEPMWDA